jgi:hypothetical protein
MQRCGSGMVGILLKHCGSSGGGAVARCVLCVQSWCFVCSQERGFGDRAFVLVCATQRAVYLDSIAPGGQCDKADMQLAKETKAVLGISEVGAQGRVRRLHLVHTDGILNFNRQRLPRQKTRVRIVALSVVLVLSHFAGGATGQVGTRLR